MTEIIGDRIVFLTLAAIFVLNGKIVYDWLKMRKNGNGNFPSDSITQEDLEKHCKKVQTEWEKNLLDAIKYHFMGIETKFKKWHKDIDTKLNQGEKHFDSIDKKIMSLYKYRTKEEEDIFRNDMKFIKDNIEKAVNNR